MNKNSLEYKKTLTTLKKAHSLIYKITEMMERQDYCIDVMQQNLAALGLLKSAHAQLMENHIKTCFSRAMKSSNEKQKDKMTKEILQVTKLYNK
ncbi:MAG: metal-sensitive transcriptional regulator [Candidatus Pacebacteria bacterium]|nr:metal-sensitive transcriptional regulator [Candidatus Paceibacterota bacterium]